MGTAMARSFSTPEISTNIFINRSFEVHTSFIVAFAKFRKATVSFVMSVRPSVRMQQLGSHWTDFD